MGHGPDDKIFRPPGNTPPVDPALLARPDVRAALAGHDIGALFRVLNENGWSQRGIGRAAGMHQSEVSEIIKGRRVIGYQVLVRIVDGLGIPRALMNLGPAADGGAYAGGVTVTGPTEEVDAEMRRRALLAAAMIAVMGPPVERVGELAALPGPSPVLPPSRILGVHVAKVRALTQKLRKPVAPTAPTRSCSSRCLPRHRYTEFLKFLRTIDREVPKGLQIHMILDNYGTHSTPTSRNG